MLRGYESLHSRNPGLVGSVLLSVIRIFQAQNTENMSERNAFDSFKTDHHAIPFNGNAS